VLESHLVDIRSRDFWVKVVEMLQQNWELLDQEADSGMCTAFFVNDRSGVFDRMNFPSYAEAEVTLRRNGFSRLSEDQSLQEFLSPPRPPFRVAQHPNGPIYSSGRYRR